MKNIQIEKLSNAYTIRRLTDADVPMLYAWMLRNDQYFRYCGGGTTPERVRQDLTGTMIVRDVLAALCALGYTAVRLGIDKENPQSNHFWRKNGFAVLREAAQERGIVLLAERRLA